MSNDPRDHGGLRLKQALLQLGRNEMLRAELVRWLKAAEQHFDSTLSVRDEITGPIIDALHADSDQYEKSLEDGTKFSFYYRTKIARDFLLSDREHPSHVWEPQTTRLLKYLSQQNEGDVLVGGAYFGDHAILLGRQLVGSCRQVHCFEPNAAQAEMLQKNVALNQLSNLVINRTGIWDATNQLLKLDGFDSFANAVLVDGGEDSFPTTTIDDYCQQAGRQLGLLMLDIEGAEYRALKGALNMLKRDRPAVVFELHREYVDWTSGLLHTPICELLTSLGYTLYAIRDFNSHREMGNQLIELIPAGSVYLEGPPHGFNMLAVQDRAVIETALFRIVSGVSPKLLVHKDPKLHHPLDGLQ
ncbi:FkbM family methyltransferase [Castellaniella denitrificans]|uniref:FkbM family methyltransferase n=1 Tax=Castellaniella denitrificans TaxID=56119 RepID=A0ABT4M4F6_9BURK|nr:FkbM family methyltransferase [Castellaniella denitrificans]MCZ4330203.1 FkbM family methyltransferase [Castellaniella denitrificans]